MPKIARKVFALCFSKVCKPRRRSQHLEAAILARVILGVTVVPEGNESEIWAACR